MALTKTVTDCSTNPPTVTQVPLTQAEINQAAADAAAQATLDAAQATLTAANVQQNAAVANLLAGAVTLLTNYAAARATMATAVGALPANPTAAQLATFIKGPLATYLVADNDTEVAVIKGLGNFIARQTGNTATF